MNVTELFSNHKNKSIDSTLLKVFRKWDILFSDPLEMKSITFNGNSVNARDICVILRKSPLLTDISLVSIDEVVPILRQMCRSNKQLESLTLDNCSSRGKPVPEETLINVLQSFPDLSSINLQRTKLKSQKFYRLLSTKPNITSVDLSLNEFITYRDLLTIIHNSRLKEFKMSRRHRNLSITDLEMSYLVKSLKNQLVLLHLDMSGMGDYTYTEIVHCSRLVDLKLNYAMNLTSKLLGMIPGSLKKIQSFKVEGPTMLTDGDLYQYLFCNLNFSQPLTVLKLKNFDSLTDDECKKILKACSQLKILSLKGCKSLTVKGLFKELVELKDLLQLNLGFTGSSVGIEDVFNLPKLNELIVDHQTYLQNNLATLEGKQINIVKLTKK